MELSASILISLWSTSSQISQLAGTIFYCCCKKTSFTLKKD